MPYHVGCSAASFGSPYLSLYARTLYMRASERKNTRARVFRRQTFLAAGQAAASSAQRSFMRRRWAGHESVMRPGCSMFAALTSTKSLVKCCCRADSSRGFALKNHEPLFESDLFAQSGLAALGRAGPQG